MKQPLVFAICSIALIGVAPLRTIGQTNLASQAASHATGSVTGRVQNVVTGNYLNKARVSVKGTDLVAYTDEFGTYRLVDVPVGEKTLEIFYTELDVQPVPLTINPRSTVERAAWCPWCPWCQHGRARSSGPPASAPYVGSGQAAQNRFSRSP